MNRQLNRYRYVFYLVGILLLLHSFINVAIAQLTTQKRTPYDLVKNTLLGTGITISNVRFNGIISTATTTAKYDNIGFFKGNTNLGLDSGIVMTTGTILNNGDGPHGPNNNGSAGLDNFLGGDTDLDALTASTGTATTTHNKAILEFDFVPAYDTVKFRYVFGSEEYPEFVNSVNDVFGFFIRGPGISGTFTLNSKNIALIPNTTSPITINSVNNGNTNTGPCTNCAYYIDNQTIPGTTIQYDGFTSVLTAISHVQCGATYHIKMAIADASDGIYDSGVFLEALSFSSPVVTINSAVSLGGAGHTGAAGDTVLYEGCGIAVLDFIRGGNTALADTVHFTIAGSAAMGSDFLAIPDSVVFAAGQNHSPVIVQAIEDNVAEGFESIILTPINVNPSSCLTVTTKPFKLYLSDVVPVIANASADSSIICPNQNSTIDAFPSGGIPGYTYLWNQGIGSGKRHTVAPAITTTYIVTVTDTCGSHVATDSVTISVDTYSPVVASVLPADSIYCPGASTTITAQGGGGAAFYTYTWDNGLGSGASKTVNPATTSNYTVTVRDTCGNTAASTVTVVVVPYVPLQMTISKDTVVCENEPVTLIAMGIDGFAPYSYSWNKGTFSDSSITVNSSKNKSYIVAVSDNCGYSTSDTVGVYISKPKAKFGYYFESDLLAQFIDSSVSNIVHYYWDFGDNTTSFAFNPIHEYAFSQAHQVKLIVTDTIGCLDSVSETVFPPMSVYIPTAFSPNGDAINDIFMVRGTGIKDFEFSVFNRWGELIFKSNDVAQSWNPKNIPEGIYVYVIHASSIDNKPFSKTGTITIMK